ncbi:hypothetical protein RHMOL_Rhmol07G0307800 [Rhododendron molle]|uniref:Uncharacterized protein n=1 Tax=Rhododendron molle TaxID=49168 RepID=A0ACC0N6B9_RHOML|nr:hypothetical protein RHMOL_Rhmol07G0307800 [Rhododendron molle]
MDSSSGNSSGRSAQIQKSGSEEGLVDQRKRKRMQSNRESARRSRMRKQKHLDDLMAVVTQLKDENSRIMNKMSITTQQCLNVEAENSVLSAQMGELSQRLESLNNILNCLNTTTAAASGFVFESEDFESIPESYMDNSWNLMYLNPPILASPDMFQY